MKRLVLLLLILAIYGCASKKTVVEQKSVDSVSHVTSSAFLTSMDSLFKTIHLSIDEIIIEEQDTTSNLLPFKGRSGGVSSPSNRRIRIKGLHYNEQSEEKGKIYMMSESERSDSVQSEENKMIVRKVQPDYWSMFLLFLFLVFVVLFTYYSLKRALKA